MLSAPPEPMEKSVKLDIDIVRSCTLATRKPG
jgi:hypothetical protein